MSEIVETGTVRETRGEVHVEWEIPDFYDSDKTKFQSPFFSLTDSLWRLKMFTDSSVEMFLERKDSGPPKSVKLLLGIKTAFGDENTVSGICRIPTKRYSVSTTRPIKFASKSYLMDIRSRLVPSDVITVTCTLSSFKPHTTEVSLSNRLWSLSEDLRYILTEKKGTDFTLKVDGCDFPVHRMILVGRCDYFADMLGNGFQESETGVAEIDDIEKDVFQFILVYLYTAEVKGISNENVCKIYVAAYKLRLGELTDFCVDYMKENLSKKLICGAVAIAEKYEESGLEKHVLDYFTPRSNEIFQSDEWNTFKVENKALALNFLEKLIFKGMKLVTMGHN